MKTGMMMLQAKEHNWELERGLWREDTLLTPWFRTGLGNCKTTSFCGSAPPSVWDFGAAALAQQCRPEACVLNLCKETLG